MRSFRPLLLVAGLAAGLLASPSLADQSANGAANSSKRVCPAPADGFAACDAYVRTKGGYVTPDATTTYTSGYSPTQLRTAYGLTTDSTTWVAIVDAYRHPTALTDLNVYRKQFNIPLLDATTFAEYDQTGGTLFATGDVGWGQEEMLDLEMVSAICPSCKIIYVGAKSASFADLAAAVNTAAAKGAKVISNSYGGAESSTVNTYAGAYNKPGIAITVSSGDSGYGVQSPASYNTVTAVGGTSLTLNTDGTRKTETVWSGAGSGCSAYITKPSFQVNVATGCAKRMVADVAAVADPATGVAVYDSYGSTGGASWLVFGGTSVAAPIIGGVYALSGDTNGVPASFAYSASTGTLFDVVSGSNGRCVRGKSGTASMCNGAVGYDGPTGMGTPKGNLAAF